MMTLAANKQRMHYALLIGQVPVYALDEDGNKIVEYVDEEGNEYYRETGEYELQYSTPVEFWGNISMSSGESNAQEFGVDISQYDAVIVLNKDEIPVTETSIIWHISPVVYKDASQTLPDAYTADYEVTAIKPSLHQQKFLLRAITK